VHGANARQQTSRSPGSGRDFLPPCRGGVTVCPFPRCGHAQGQAQLGLKMAFRPASLASVFHKRLAEAVDKRHTKVLKVRSTTTVVDPKRAKAEKEKEEEARIRER
jgi:Leo1-like protein